jgi:glyoxylase-like metal-dependent hydrolase (beta-lactamase superfamily II)
VPILLHEADLPLYHGTPQQAAMFGLRADPLPEPDGRLEAGQPITVGTGVRLEVVATPGHAPGHVMFVAPELGWALVGDVVFQGSIGRTDLPGGDFGELMRSIRERVLTLPDETRLLPGHGPETTVGRERVGNPFLVPVYRGHFA